MTTNLELEAMEALRGAADAREQVLKIMQIGSPSISDLAYAVKARVKDDYKLVEKVKKKRLEKLDYRMSDVRDIVGLRIITLYRLDALRIVPILLDRIRDNEGAEETKLFLPNPIEEVKIYSVNPSGDAQKLAKRLQNTFEDKGIKGNCKIEETPQNYSSTHIVVWARGKWAGNYKQIPIEIQVRTALEDVWSEIDHQLKYKRESEEFKSEETSARIENCLAHLNVMKTLNDGLAQYGDQVKIQLEEIDEGVRRISRVRLSEEPTKRLDVFGDFPQKTELVSLLGHTREALNDYRFSSHSGSSRITKLKACRALLDTAESSERLITGNNLLDEEIRYIVEMEKALVEFDLGRQLGISAGNSHLLNAQEIYTTQEGRYPDRGIIQFRLARVEYELGQREQAKSRLESFLDEYDKFDLSDDHWVHSSAYRILGFWHWDSVEKSKGKVDAATVDAASLKNILQSVRCSLRARDIPVTESSSPNEVPHESSRVMATSNAIFFIIEFIEHGGDWADLEEFCIDRGRLDVLVSELSQFDEAGMVDFHKLNTLRRACISLGDQDRAQRYSEMAIRNLEGAGYHDRGGNTVEEHVLRECRKTLRGH